MRILPRIMLYAVLVAVPLPLVGQGMPTAQPGVLSIYIEELKLGASADHEVTESGWPAAYAKAKSPFYYLALESMTGTQEVWFVVPFASWAKEAESMKEADSNPALAAELKRLRKADAQHLSGIRTLQAMARPDLSFGEFPDMSAVRYYEISTFRVRPGRNQGFEAAAKIYANVMKASRPNASYRMYQVTGGMPDGTYLVFGSNTDYAAFDTDMAEGQKMWEKASAADLATLQKAMQEDVMNVVTNRYRVNPKMSYVAPEAKAKAPNFWQ